MLVERVEGFCTDAEWKRAYREINEFERQLTDDGAIIIKLYSRSRRTSSSSASSAARPIPTSTGRSARKTGAIAAIGATTTKSAEEMFEKTSTENAPWIVIPGNFKWYARVRAVKAVAERIAEKLKD